MNKSLRDYKISLISIALIITACTSLDKKVLSNETGLNTKESIVYEGSERYGYYINVDSEMDGKETHYNIKLTDDGTLLKINKYDRQYHGKENSLAAWRNVQFLVSDTNDKNNPKFFGHEINGYYRDSFVVNTVILKQDKRWLISPLTHDEIKMFSRIDSLALAKNVKYRHFEESKVLGWFKYQF